MHITSVLLKGIFHLCVLVLLCFNSAAIFSCRILPAGREGRWLGHRWVKEGGARGRGNGGWTGDITAWGWSYQHQVPEALELNNGACEGQVERSGGS